MNISLFKTFSVFLIYNNLHLLFIVYLSAAVCSTYESIYFLPRFTPARINIFLTYLLKIKSEFRIGGFLKWHYIFSQLTNKPKKTPKTVQR